MSVEPSAELQWQHTLFKLADQAIMRRWSGHDVSHVLKDYIRNDVHATATDIVTHRETLAVLISRIDPSALAHVEPVTGAIFDWAAELNEDASSSRMMFTMSYLGWGLKFVQPVTGEI